MQYFSYGVASCSGSAASMRAAMAISSIGAMREPVTLRDLLRALADLDRSGGGTPSLVAWELEVEEPRVLDAWARAEREGLIHLSARREPRWRLTPGGWAATPAHRRA
jgi:hypothetical protein